jgi:hypothetical protein
MKKLLSVAMISLGLIGTSVSAGDWGSGWGSGWNGVQGIALGTISGENLTGAVGGSSKAWSNLYKSESMGLDLDTSGPDRAFTHLRLWGDGGAHAVDHGHGSAAAGTAVEFSGGLIGAVDLSGFKMPAN